MHAAPSVSYPVGRSAFAGALHAAVFLLALAATSAWALAADAPGWRHALAGLAVLACGTFAFVRWVGSPAGVLRWDGAGWQWQERAGNAIAALDLQSRLLLRWRGEEGVTHWLWIERESDSAHWEALRRAVYSRASTPLPSAGKSPAAEQ